MNTTKCFLSQRFLCGAKGAVCDDAFCVRAFRVKVGVYVHADCKKRCPLYFRWINKRDHVEHDIKEVL